MQSSNGMVVLVELDGPMYLKDDEANNAQLLISKSRKDQMDVCFRIMMKLTPPKYLAGYFYT